MFEVLWLDAAFPDLEKAAVNPQHFKSQQLGGTMGMVMLAALVSVR